MTTSPLIDEAYPCTLSSIQDRVARRLLPDDVMELQARDKVISVLPMENPRTEGRNVRSCRSNLESCLKKILTNGKLASFQGLSGTQKDKVVDKQIRKRHSIKKK